MKNPSVEDRGILGREILNRRIVCAREHMTRRSFEHVQNVRTAPRPRVRRLIEHTVELDRILAPAARDRANVLVEAGNHGHMTGPRLGRHLGGREGESSSVRSLFTIINSIRKTSLLFFFNF